jgi:hypothetical protein
VARVISFDAIVQQAEEHRAELHRQAAIERLVGMAPTSARPAALRVRLARLLRRAAELVDAPGCGTAGSCSQSPAGA